LATAPAGDKRAQVTAKYIGQNARATTQEGCQGPSTTPAAASKTERESPRNRTRCGTRAAPKNPSNSRQSTTQKLPQHLLHPAQREDNKGRDKRRSDRTTIPPPDNGNDTPERTEPTDETHRAETRKPPQTEHEATANGHRSDQTDDANARHKPTAKATASRTNERRDTHQDTAAEDTRRNRTKDRDTRRTGHETAERTQAQETTQQGDKAHTTTQPHNAHNKRQRTEARGGNKQSRQATQNHRAIKSTKNTNMAKNRKTRAKKMVVGGKLLRGRKLQARKRPFEPDQRARRPKRRDEDEERRR